MRQAVTFLTVAVLAALAASYGGALHPVGDSLAVFRTGIAAAGAALLLALRPVAWLFRTGLALSLGSLGLIGWHKVEPDPPGPITVYQKNMYHANSGLADLVADIRDAGADLVLLQEVSVANAAILTDLRDAFPHQHLCRYTRRSGIAVLSRFEPAGGNTFCLRGVGMAGLKVETGSGPVWAVSLHLTHPFPHNQERQVDRVAGRLAALDAPIVLGGDFNMVAWSHTLGEIAEASGTELAGPPRTSFFLGPVPLSIDHVLAPGGGATATRPDFGSDHRGILARVSATAD